MINSYTQVKYLGGKTNCPLNKFYNTGYATCAKFLSAKVTKVY